MRDFQNNLILCGMTCFAKGFKPINISTVNKIIVHLNVTPTYIIDISCN